MEVSIGIRKLGNLAKKKRVTKGICTIGQTQRHRFLIIFFEKFKIFKALVLKKDFKKH